MPAIKQVEEKNYITLVVKGNALKRRSEKAFEDAKKLQEAIVLLKEKRQKMQRFFFFYIYCLGKN